MAKGKKTGGRTAGTPNKSNQALIDKCLEAGLDVFDAMLELTIEAKGATRFRYLETLAEYLYPKRKAIEVRGETNASITFERLDGTGERYTLERKGESEE